MGRYSLSNGTINFPERLVHPPAPAAGRFEIYVLGGMTYIMDSSGTPKSFESIYGQDLQYISEFYTDTSTSNTFTTYGGTTYPAGLGIAGRIYKITLSIIQRYSTVGRNFICRVSVDGTTLEQEIAVENKDSGSDIRVPLTYQYFVDGSSLNNLGGFLDIDYRCQNNGDTATVYSASLEFIRVK